ncbi:MAG: AsmA family protein [Steroidobacteraceae bacterium]
MQLKKPLILIPVAIAILALAAIAVLWLGVQTAMARRTVAGWVTDAVGLPATIESLRVAFLPLPALDIGGLTIAQPPGFGPDPLLEVERVRASIPWGSLFGLTAVESISISDAIARLEIAADGESNWSQLFGQPSVGGGEARPAWSLGKLDLERGALEFQDKAADSRWRLTAITIGAEDVAPAAVFPLELRFGGVFGANTIHYVLKGRGKLDPAVGRYEASGLDFRGWAGGEPLPLAGLELAGAMNRASFDSATGMAMLDSGRFNLAGISGEFGGTFNLDAPKLEADIRVKTDPFAPRPPAIAFGFPLPATADPKAYQTLQLTLQGRMREGELHLDPVTGRLDDTQFEGRIVPGRRLIRANLDRIDVNRYLSPEKVQISSGQKEETLEAAIAELGRFDIDAEIRVQEARVGRAKLRDSVIRVERGGGETS